MRFAHRETADDGGLIICAGKNGLLVVDESDIESMRWTIGGVKSEGFNESPMSRE